MQSRDPLADISVADAEKGNWVDHYAPRAVRPYLRLSRLDRPSPALLLFWPCVWGVGLAAASSGPKQWDLWILAGCALGAFLMRGAGCTWNDITDRNFDAEVERTKSRPIPAGQVSVRGALIWAILQCLLAALILFSYNTTAILLGVLALVPVVIYPFAKRFTWWPQVFLGIAFNWGALLAWVAHAGHLSLAPVLLYLSGIAWTLFYDTIYAHQDKEDDALIGIKSTARLFGEHTQKWLQAFLIIAVLLMSGAVLIALQESSMAALVVAMVGIWGFGLHMHRQLSHLDIDDPEVCLYHFRSNRITGLIPAVFFVIAAFV